MVPGVEPGFVLPSSDADAVWPSRGNPASFWLKKLLIKVFVLSFALTKPLLQSAKILSIMKLENSFHDCGPRVFTSSNRHLLSSWLWGWEKLPVNTCVKLLLALCSSPVQLLVCSLSSSWDFLLYLYLPARAPCLGQRLELQVQAVLCWPVCVS